MDRLVEAEKVKERLVTIPTTHETVTVGATPSCTLFRRATFGQVFYTKYTMLYFGNLSDNLFQEAFFMPEFRFAVVATAVIVGFASVTVAGIVVDVTMRGLNAGIDETFAGVVRLGAARFITGAVGVGAAGVIIGAVGVGATGVVIGTVGVGAARLITGAVGVGDNVGIDETLAGAVRLGAGVITGAVGVGAAGVIIGAVGVGAARFITGAVGVGLAGAIIGAVGVCAGVIIAVADGDSDDGRAVAILAVVAKVGATDIVVVVAAKEFVPHQT